MNVPAGLMLESSGRMSCLQLTLVDEQHNISLVQVTVRQSIRLEFIICDLNNKNFKAEITAGDNQRL